MKHILRAIIGAVIGAVVAVALSFYFDYGIHIDIVKMFGLIGFFVVPIGWLVADKESAENQRTYYNQNVENQNADKKATDKENTEKQNNSEEKTITKKSNVKIALWCILAFVIVVGSAIGFGIYSDNREEAKVQAYVYSKSKEFQELYAKDNTELANLYIASQASENKSISDKAFADAIANFVIEYASSDVLNFIDYLLVCTNNETSLLLNIPIDYLISHSADEFVYNTDYGRSLVANYLMNKSYVSTSKAYNEVISMYEQERSYYISQYGKEPLEERGKNIIQKYGTEYSFETIAKVILYKINGIENLLISFEKHKTSTKEIETTVDTNTTNDTSEEIDEIDIKEETAKTTADIHNIKEEEEQVKVPDLKGMTESEAKKAIKNAGLQYGETEIYEDSSKPKGKVIYQSIDAGNMVDKDTEIIIGVNEVDEIEEVKVPDLKGMTEAEAKKAIKNAKLQYGGTEIYDMGTSFPNKRVFDQSEPAGSMVEKDTKITIEVNEY